MRNSILEYWKGVIGKLPPGFSLTLSVSETALILDFDGEGFEKLQESKGRESIGDSAYIGRIRIVTATDDEVRDSARTMVEEAERVLAKEAV